MEGDVESAFAEEVVEQEGDAENDKKCGDDDSGGWVELECNENGNGGESECEIEEEFDDVVFEVIDESHLSSRVLYSNM